MHPLVARIHPSLRTGFFAWFVGRAALWLTLLAHGTTAYGGSDGGPGWSGFRSLTGLAGPDHGMWIRIGIGEVAMFLAAVAVYRFARREGLPQAAERTTWLWACSPALVATMPGSAWTYAIALVAIAIGCVANGRALVAALLASAAIAVRPEAVLVWPGMAAIAFRSRGESPAGFGAVLLVPIAAFSAAVIGGVLLGDPHAILGDVAWRGALAWRGVDAQAADLAVAGAVAVGAAVTIVELRRSPNSWPLLAVPCLAWPLLLEPAFGAVAVLALCVPTYAQLGRLTDDPSFERPLLAAFVVALCLLTSL